MRKNNIAKIEKAIQNLGTNPFSIADICKQSKVSDPTVRNYLKGTKEIALREVCYGKYQVIETKATITNINPQAQNPQTPEKDRKEMKKSNKQEISHQGEQVDPSKSTMQIHGDIYLNAYLKGFDRGFELGLKKAAELTNNNSTQLLAHHGRQ